MNELISRQPSATDTNVGGTDCISRAAVVAIVEEVESKRLRGEIDLTYAPMLKGIKALPPAQPGCEDAVPWEQLERYAEWFCAQVSYPEFIREAKAFCESTIAGMKGGNIAPSVTPKQPGWILCTPETMPKMSAMTETYLVKVGINECGEGMHTEVRTADWYSSSKMWNVHESEKSIVGEVTAWMPIPWERGQDENN